MQVLRAGQMRPIAVAVACLAAACVSAADKPATDTIVGTTLLHFDPFHGSQVEYYAPNGRAYLWYPGNASVVRSSYREDAEAGEICFVYPSTSYNPATREHGGEEECRPEAQFWGGVREAVDGDFFGLASRDRVPYVLPRALTTLDALLARVNE